MNVVTKSEIKKIVQIRCVFCEGTGFVKSKKIIIHEDLEEINFKVKFPPYKECEKCYGLGYKV